MLSNSTLEGLVDLSENKKGKGKIFNIELGHTPIGVDNTNKIIFGSLNNGARVIDEGVTDSILQGFHVSKFLRKEHKRKTKLILSLSDIYGVENEEKKHIHNVLMKEEGLIEIFGNMGIDNETLDEFERLLIDGCIVFQSKGTSLISNKISALKKKYGKGNPETIYNNNGYILFETCIGEYKGLIIFSNKCFHTDFNTLNQGVPLLSGINGEKQSTQCGPTVTGIQKQIIGNDNINEIITIDNPKDNGIITKSIRGQLLLKLLYNRDSSLLSPLEEGINSFISPINLEGIKMFGYKELLSKSIESLEKSGYDSVKIYGQEDYIFKGVGGNIENKCNLGLCNL